MLSRSLISPKYQQASQRIIDNCEKDNLDSRIKSLQLLIWIESQQGLSNWLLRFSTTQKITFLNREQLPHLLSDKEARCICDIYNKIHKKVGSPITRDNIENKLEPVLDFLIQKEKEYKPEGLELSFPVLTSCALKIINSGLLECKLYALRKAEETVKDRRSKL